MDEVAPSLAVARIGDSATSTPEAGDNVTRGERFAAPSRPLTGVTCTPLSEPFRQLHGQPLHRLVEALVVIVAGGDAYVTTRAGPHLSITW